MKKIWVYFIFGLLSIFHVSAFAYPPGVTLISSKLEMSPGLRGGYIDKPVSSIATSKSVAGGARAYAKARHGYGRANDNVKIDSDHNYIIENRSGTTQYYEIEYRIILQDGRFIRKQDVVAIMNNQSARGGSYLYTNQYFGAPGEYAFTADTSIRGDMRDYTKDIGYVSVSG